jgi:hypothetical protein
LEKRKIYHIDEIGDLIVARHQKAKRYRISVRPFKPVRVTVPRWGSFKAGFRFAIERRKWIKKSLNEMKEVEEAQRAQQDMIPMVDAKEAKIILTNRLKELSEEFGFEYRRIFIRNQKSRWGSCSEANNINLNINLARLEPELRDYVILHELVHTKVKSHGKRFWLMMEKRMPGAKQLDKELKKYHLGLD